MDPLTWPEVQPELSDDRVRLRPFLPEDATWVYEACQGRDRQRWTRVPDPYGRHDAEDFVGDLVPSEWRAGGPGSRWRVSSARRFGVWASSATW